MHETPSSKRSIKRRSARHLLLTFLTLACLLFFPAGSWRFWQAWLFLSMIAAFWSGFLLYFLKHDPKLLERRLQRHEAEREQKLFQKLFLLLLLPALILSSLDFRFGWSRMLAPLPTLVIVAGQFVTVAGYYFVFWVMRTNTFAASTIQVEAGQYVIDRGPYEIVRHPMYLGMAIAFLGMPFALGSYIALPLFVLLVLLLVYRLIHEERALHRSLPGYSEFCERTRFRLVPWVW